MAIDFSTFGDYIDEERYYSSVTAKGLNKDLRGVLSNRGFPRSIVGDAPFTYGAVDPITNTNGKLYLTQNYIVPAVTFIADWEDISSYVLTYYQFGDGEWANEPSTPPGPDPDPTDPDFANVTVLLHMDGAEGGTAITDSSSIGHFFTAVNGAVTTSTEALFDQSASFDGSNDRIEGSSLDVAFGAGDFTIEWAQYLNSTKNMSPIDMRDGVANSTRPLVYNTGDDLIYRVDNATLASWPNSLVTGTWQRFAISRVAGTTHLYLNGSRVAQVADTSNYDCTAMYVGANTVTTTRTIDGYIDELRITKGVGRYSDASYSLDAAPFPDQ